MTNCVTDTRPPGPTQVKPGNEVELSDKGPGLKLPIQSQEQVLHGSRTALCVLWRMAGIRSIAALDLLG